MQRNPECNGEVNSITLPTGVSTTEPWNCNYIIKDNLCIVNLSAVTISSGGAIAIDLPLAGYRSNITVPDGGGGVVILYIDPLTGILNCTSAVTGLYTQLVYRIA